MCSGCSGDYEGTFEFEPGTEPPHRVADDGYPAADARGAFNEAASEFDAKGAGSFEVEEHLELNPRPQSQRRAGGDYTSERCEIRVSATQIMEIRVITAQGGEQGEARSGRRAKAPPRGKHSRRVSAKYYRTRSPAASVSRSAGGETLWLWRMAALAARGFKTCARRARRVLRW